MVAFVKFEATKDDLQALIAEGLSQTQMGERLGVTPPTIGTRLRLFGLKCDGRALWRGVMLPRGLAEKLLAEGLNPVAIANRVGCSEGHARARLREYKLLEPARRGGSITRVPRAPRVPDDDLRSLSGLHTSGELMFERIRNQESMVIGRGYIEVSRGLNKAADVIIRAKSKCGVAVSFLIGARVPKTCGPRCACQTGYRGKRLK